MSERSSMSPSTSLREAFKNQEEQFSVAFAILQQAIQERVFPAASLAVTYRGDLVAWKAFGNLTYDRHSPAVELSTLFDLASLTKVVAATPMAMLLYQRGLLDLEAPVSAIVPEIISNAEPDARRRKITLRMLLAHSSGLPAYEKLFLKARTRDELLRAAFTVPLVADPGSRTAYSDVGFIILGVALERLADECIDSFCRRELFAPLEMIDTAFNPPSEIRARIPPTANDQTFRHKIVQGEVYDENASVLGGVAPHAGLFSTPRDVAKFAHCMLRSGGPVFRAATVALFTHRESEPKATSRALGWDTPSSPSQSGKYFSPNSFGHLGYTGTSLWIDPVRQLSLTLLTNRTWPDSANQAIKQMRPKFHDAILEALSQFE